MGERAFVPFLLFRVILPVALLTAAVVRFNAVSFMYLVLLLLTPLLRVPSRASMSGVTGKFLPLVITLSLLPIIGHSVFHIVLAGIATDTEPYGYDFSNCSEREKIIRQIGFQILDEPDAGAIIRLIGPDVLVFLTAILVMVLSKRATQTETSMLQADAASGSGRWATKDYVYHTFVMALLQSLALVLAGLMVPSIFNAVYFLMFLIIMILWGCYKSMGMGFGYIRLLLLLYTGSHLLLLHLYQFQFFQEVLQPSDLMARVFGLTGIIYTDCSDLRNIHFYPDLPWYVYVNPAAILLLYWILAFSTNLWRKRRQKLQQQKAFRRASVGSEQQVEVKSPQANELEEEVHRCIDSETGSMVFSGSSYGIHVDDEKGDNETSRLLRGSGTVYTESDRLVESEQPPGGHYGGLEDQGAQPSNDDAEDPTCQPDEQDKSQGTKRTIWVSFIVLIIKQSYVLSLVAMMAWSIAFLSWLAFALLLVACFLWMMPNSRLWCLRASPFILFYVICLLMALYAFNMDLKPELPEHAGGYELSEIGMEKFTYPCVSLGIQCLFTFLIVLSVRQFVKEKNTEVSEGQNIMLREKGKKQSFLQRLLEGSHDYDLTVPSGNMNAYDSNTTLFIGNFMWVILSKYWIFFCTIMLAVISLTDVVIYRIIYMILCALFILTFQVNFTLWRKLMYSFWWVVIFYSMLVLIALYTYQFKDFPDYWKNATGFDNDVLKDIGLEKYDTAGLFIKLLTPTLFLIIVIIQVRYFHDNFLKLSALDRFKYATDEVAVSDEEGHAQNITEDEEEALSSSDKSQRNLMKNLVIKGAVLWRSLTNFSWRLAEVHFFKVVIIVVAVVSVHEVSALTFVYLLLLAIFMPCHSTHLLLSHLIQLWTVVIILARMIFQLNLMDTAYWQTTCDAEPGGNTTNGTSSNGTEKDNAKWFGLEKISDRNIANYEKLFILVMVIVVLESIIRYHQRQHFNHPHNQQPPRGIIFIKITRPNADETLLKCLMYFANYAFYKFGLEICFVMTAITVSIRVDAISAIYMIFMCILMLCKRRTVARVWPLYTIVLAIMLPIQFLIVIGFPPGACIDYPWEAPLPNNLGLWLFLPSYKKPPGAVKLVADTIQLLFVCLQSFVFYLEAHPVKMQEYGGGDNKEILEEVENNTPNPYPDFTIKHLTHMDLIKGFVFEFMFWVTMAIIFVTGVTRINIFSLFYVIAVFYFMWYGSELFLKPLRSLLQRWNKLILLCIFVLISKALLQLIGCVYANDLIGEGQCWLIQLFGINCVLANADALPSPKDNCIVNEDDAGLAWDVVCFTFLLLQRRIYLSHYFRHVVDTLMARQQLASRGAEIINRILIREVNRQKEQETIILNNIKKQMEAIKTKQAKLRKDFKEPEEHFQAIRAGDYYLLADVESKEEEKQPTTLTFGKDTEAEEGMDPLQVIHTAGERGADAAIEAFEEQDENKEKDEDKDKEEEESESGNKIKTILLLVYTLWLSFIDWLIRVCNSLSRNYRLVGKKLSAELVIEKQKIVEKRQERAGQSKEIEDQDSAAEAETVRLDMSTTEDQSDFASSQVNPISSTSLEELEKLDSDHMQLETAEKTRFFRLLKAASMLISSRSELLCYFLMILNQIVHSSLLTLPLPLMVFLWGMLSVPRPSKSFWITVITYTEAIVVVKYLFQFGFLPWNERNYPESPYFPPRFIGIGENPSYANVDIALLLALFLHRSLLRRYGLWKDAADISADLEAAEKKEKTALPALEENSKAEGVAGSSTDAVEDKTCKEEEAKPSKIKLGLQYLISPFSTFFKQLTNSGYNASVDVYAPMFACDFILFIVLVLGFASFGPAETAGGSVTSYIKNNKIPVPFLIMILTQFIFIIIDRALFLRKQVLGKLIYQILLVIVLHIWLFFVLPRITKRSFFDNRAAQIWYFIKCIYFALSAYQIRCGYPARILGNFLTKSYGYVSLIAFKVFMAIPFLLELRSLMDWIWTDSTLAIGSWLQMEDIYANIFQLKCSREIEKKYPTERAQKKGIVVKYLVGGILLVIIIFIIWFPLVFFSLFNSIFVSNPPTKAIITIGMGGYLPFFTTNAVDPNKSLRKLTGAEYDRLKGDFDMNQGATAFLSGFEAEDVTLVTFDGASLDTWSISPESRLSLIEDLANDTATSSFLLTMTVSFIRNYQKGDAEGTQDATFSLNMREPKYKEVRKKLAHVINGTDNNPVTINSLFSRYLHLAGSHDVEPVTQMMEGKYGTDQSNITVSLRSDSANTTDWWDVHERLYGPTFFESTRGYVTTGSIYFVTFNDRRVPDTLSFLSGYGIIGLYISFILLIGRLLRGSVSGQHLTIMFRELPDVDRVLRLCLDIYLVREMKEFHLEEDLYASLIFLYRSPETLIQYTRQTVRIGNIKKKND